MKGMKGMNAVLRALAEEFGEPKMREGTKLFPMSADAIAEQKRHSLAASEKLAAVRAAHVALKVAELALDDEQNRWRHNMEILQPEMEPYVFTIEGNNMLVNYREDQPLLPGDSLKPEVEQEKEDDPAARQIHAWVDDIIKSMQ